MHFESVTASFLNMKLINILISCGMLKIFKIISEIWFDFI